MIKTVKIQSNNKTNGNVYINLPKEMREALNMKKGDTLLLRLEDNKIIITK